MRTRIAVELICERLRSGRIVAIDRSAKMIRAAMRRNARHVAAGRVEFHVAELESFGPRQRTFGRELAIRVAIFHREPDRAQALIRRWLKPGARVVSVFDEP